MPQIITNFKNFATDFHRFFGFQTLLPYKIFKNKQQLAPLALYSTKLLFPTNCSLLTELFLSHRDMLFVANGNLQKQAPEERPFSKCPKEDAQNFISVFYQTTLKANNRYLFFKPIPYSFCFERPANKAKYPLEAQN
ncbi:hypothetical protein [Flavobacterium limnophilum]|uniref:hypothetical protein n=1 Tax=Flavobacterium limnophilum TaxID=3003262 RepID=UPI0022ABEC04|nr:hypothetical protein [Flavobacterium limnophilum]